jgi:Protein of unknown function (DUF2795)
MAETSVRISPAQIAKLLEGVDLPANKQDLVRYVRDKTQTVIQFLERLPDQEYRTMADVMKAIGEVE